METLWEGRFRNDSGLLLQLRRQARRIRWNVFLNTGPALYRQPKAAVRRMDVDLEFVKRAATAPQFQPLRDIDQRRLRRVDAESIPVAQLPRCGDGRNDMLAHLTQLLSLLRRERLRIAGDRWKSLARYGPGVPRKNCGQEKVLIFIDRSSELKST
jgi:hypothetical protein